MILESAPRRRSRQIQGRSISESGRSFFEPYAAAIVLVEETVKLSDRILGRLGSHSNLFRHGIFASMGPQIDPGYSGRMRVSLSNPTEHPFLIRHKSAFITAEFVLLTKAPRKKYAGTPGEPDLTEDEINRILGRGGPSLKDLAARHT